ncbi:hypothetical protein T440DRAFT_474651 [Plenodomus tracheiphilus IPT5]|uniref:Uncharacterized protein n=1 Tax=Plenodomus tracheiphilus IPT5 TaxID=1408161 RepID=A0A6A7BP90_9PLEO|nr:hypothetical protein T440DRAFT_474651 [Plenodomus tracheiphilus IPT5]
MTAQVKLAEVWRIQGAFYHPRKPPPGIYIMLEIHRTDNIPDTKIYFSHSVLPTYIDPENVSTKKQPFSTFNKQLYSHSLGLILPEELYELVKHEIYRIDGASRAQYARVHMKIGELLEGEFLDSYIKQGNVMMLSEGRPLVDNRFSLHDGILRMELNRPTFERCGLPGQPIEDGGKKHQKQRWVVQYDLKASSMKHGGKAFGRLQWACRNVLNQSLAWLFYNFNPTSAESLAEGKETISKHAPWNYKIEPNVTSLDNVLMPKLSVSNLTNLYDGEDAVDLLEWLHVVSLESPRISQGDNIDPHLSRYDVPDLGKGIASANLMCIRWRGFIPPAFMRDLFIAVKRAAFKGKNRANGDSDIDMKDDERDVTRANLATKWFAMSAQAFGGKESWTTLQFERLETLVWETES